MNQRTRRMLLFLVVVFASIVPPSFAGESCQVCETRTFSGGNGAYSFCTNPEDGNWGFSSCSVQCESHGDVGGCWCTKGGDMCLYITVNG